MSRLKKQLRHVLAIVGLAGIVLAAFCAAPPAVAQGSRKDDVVFNAQGRPMAGATVRVCTSTATGQPCLPLALIYSDPGLTQALANPLSTDGLGNYSFYASPGRYEVEISGPSITTKQLPNVILPSDPTSPTFTTVTTTSGISAFSLSLTGNLTVSGSTAVTGALTVGGSPVPSTAGENQWAASQHFKGPNPWRDFTAYMKDSNGNPVNCSSAATDTGANTTGTISLSSPTTLTLAAAKDFKNGCGIAVLGAGPAPTIVTPPSTLSISSVASFSNTVTITTTANHNLVVASGNGLNQGVVVSGCANTAYNGTYPINTIPSTTTLTYVTTSSGTGSTTNCAATVMFGYAHGTTGSTTYNYKIVAIDGNMGYTAASSTLTVTSGNATLSKFNYNHIMWAEGPIPTSGGPYMWAIYSDKGLGGALTCVGTAFTNGYSDMGFTWPCPVFLPSNPPASAGAQALNTTISAGGGTTSLTLAAAATTAVSGANVYHDESSFLTACINDVNTDQGVGSLSSYGCYVPAGAYWFNGELPTATVNPQSLVRIRVAGSLVFHTIPWFFNYGRYAVEGIGGGGASGSFNYMPQATLTVGSTVAAGAVFQNPSQGNVTFNNFSLGGGSGVPEDGIWALGGSFTFNNDMINQAPAGGSAFHFEQIIGMYMDHDTVNGSGGGGMPSIWFTVSQYNAQTSCCWFITNLFTDNHGIMFSAPGGAGSNGNHNTISIANWLQESEDPLDNAMILVDSGPNAPGAGGGVPLINTHLMNLANADIAQANNNTFGLLGANANAVANVSLVNVETQQLAVCVNNLSACNSSGKLAMGNISSFHGPSLLTWIGDNSSGFVQDSNYGTPVTGYSNVSLGPMSFLQTGSSSTAAPALVMVLHPPSQLSVASTGAGSLAAGVYCMGVSGSDSTPQKNETNLSNIVCQTVSASSSIVLNWHEGIGDDLFYAYSQFNLYYCFVASGACDPNTSGSPLKLTNITSSGHAPVAFTFTSTAGATTTAPNMDSVAEMSWLSWDYNATPWSCFFCVGSHTDAWPVGFGVVPTPSVGVNIFTQLGIKVGANTFSTLSSCGSSLEGVFRAVTDSTTNTWGATITGGGANHVFAYCDGTSWTVMGK